MDTKPPDPRPENSLVALVRDLRDETTVLIRQEVALAKAELSEKATRLARNTAFIGAGAVLAYTALLLLLLALRDFLFVKLVAAGLSTAVATWLAPLIVALGIGIIAAVLIAKGKKGITDEGLVPRKSAESLREDKNWLKQKTVHP